MHPHLVHLNLMPTKCPTQFSKSVIEETNTVFFAAYLDVLVQESLFVGLYFGSKFEIGCGCYSADCKNQMGLSKTAYGKRRNRNHRKDPGKYRNHDLANSQRIERLEDCLWLYRKCCSEIGYYRRKACTGGLDFYRSIAGGYSYCRQNCGKCSHDRKAERGICYS